MSHRLLVPVSLGSCLALCAVLASPPQDRKGSAHHPPMLARPELVRSLGAPVLNLIADYYWIRTVNAVGSAATEDEFRDIYDYANMVTELDPRFRQVYVFAGAAIPFPRGRGKWVNTEESTRILEKGMKQFPNVAFIRILLAYNLTQFHQQHERAAKILAEASQLPDAPPFVAALATRLYAQAGNIEAGEILAQSLAVGAADEETRRTFEQRALELKLERELVAVDRAVAAFKAREQRLPADLESLVSAGDLARVPEDPLGGQIILGPDGRARSTEQERRVSELGK